MGPRSLVGTSSNETKVDKGHASCSTSVTIAAT